MSPRFLLLLPLVGCTGGTIDKPWSPGEDDTATSGDTGADSGAGSDTAETGVDTGDTGDTGEPDTDTDAPDTGPGTACEVDLPAAGTVSVEPACATGEDADPFEVEAEGRRLIYYYPRHTPVVGHAEDDDGDGRLGPGDHAEMVAIDRYGGSFGSGVAVYGEGYRTLWEKSSGWDGDVDPVFADLDDDGRGEIVLAAHGGLGSQMVALDAGSGDEKWRSDALDLDCTRSVCQTTAADVDGDGIAEVIVDGFVLDGATGAVEVELPLQGVAMFYRGPLVADIDMDGEREIVLGDTAYAADGTVLWSFGGEVRTGMPALVQLDDDEEAEIALALDYEILFLDTDGTVLFRDALPGAERFGWAGAPCVGDLDGDGASEVVVPAGEAIVAYEADGTLAWDAPMYGADGSGWYSGKTGCSVFDFDRDGAVEVLLGDAMTLRILDGRTGDTVWETEDYAAYMQMMVPVVADVDADGSAEILAASTGHVFSGGESWMGLQIYGHPRDAWRTEGTVWGVHDFAVANQAPGGAMAAEATATWIEPGIFRGQVALPTVAEMLPALTVTIADECAACGDDEEHVSVVVGNPGAAEAVGAAIELRAVASDRASRVLTRVAIGTVAAGETTAGVDLSWAPSALARGERIEVAAVLDGETCAIGDATVAFAPACE